MFDTGSDWLVIEDENCQNCPGLSRLKFKSSESTTFQEKVKNYKELKYASATLNGNLVSDTTCAGS